jgi:hypothetical protein
MMRLIPIAALFSFTTITTISFAQNNKFNATLSKQIDSLRNEDQSPLKMSNPDSAAKEYQRVIRSNFPVIKNIADKYGFPGYDVVGKESSNNFWLLVQHSDFDVPFQKRMLKLMKSQVDKKNASGQNYAYLIDRINLNEGGKQVYGTQVNMGQNGTTIKPCIDTLNLDKRRKQVGLPPIREYLKKCDEMFYELNKDRLNKPANPAVDSTKNKTM